MPSVRHLGLFPLCESAISDVFERSVDVLKQKGVPSFWGIKKWRLVCEISLRDRDNNSSSYSFDSVLDVTNQYTDFYTFEGNNKIVDEKSLVCAARNNHMWEFANTNGDPVDASALVVIGAQPRMLIRFNDSLPLSSKWDGYSALSGETQWGNVAVNFFSETFNLPMIGAAVASVPCGEFGTGQLEFGDFCYFENGEPIELQFDQSITARVSSVSGTLNAIEYWPYDPGDGLGPVYDTTTGAQLRAFPAD
jgi:hypothetical protein